MVKVNIISGFLGAGKTTLIKKLLTGSVAKEKIILLENEYGEVGVDGSFMKDSGIIVDELNSGCICCTLVGDFQKAVDDLIAKYHPDRLLIEPSGVGKLSEILAAVERAKAADRPGVTRGKQWVTVGNYDLLDMPGVLWKKFDSMEVAGNLAFIGSIKDDVLDIEALATALLGEMQRMYPERLAERYRLTAEELGQDAYDLLETVGRKRGMLMSGGVVNTERAAITLVDEFRGAKLGRVSLERPEEA